MGQFIRVKGQFEKGCREHDIVKTAHFQKIWG